MDNNSAYIFSLSKQSIAKPARMFLAKPTAVSIIYNTINKTPYVNFTGNPSK